MDSQWDQFHRERLPKPCPLKIKWKAAELMMMIIKMMMMMMMVTMMIMTDDHDEHDDW